jgi:signal transduction histidine kinase
MVRLTMRWLVALGCLGLVGFWVFMLVVVEHTSVPPLPVAVAVLLLVVGLAVGPWMLLVSRRLEREPEASGAFRRFFAVSAMLAAAGVVAAAILDSQRGTSTDGYAVAVVMISFLAAGVLTLVGAVLLPWLLVLTRAISRERAARVRAEERAEVATHLHDSVLQALTLIHKRADDPRAVRGLTRRADRELRAWLYGGPPDDGDDFAAAAKAVAEEVEDRFDVTVEMATVGTCRLDGPARAVIGAVREALTNAAKHAEVRHVSVFAEITEEDLHALVRDRGRGFDPALCHGTDRRGITDSIERRIRAHGGSAVVRSAPGAGTEVEVHIPRGVRHG